MLCRIYLFSLQVKGARALYFSSLINCLSALFTFLFPFKIIMILADICQFLLLLTHCESTFIIAGITILLQL